MTKKISTLSLILFIFVNIKLQAQGGASPKSDALNAIASGSSSWSSFGDIINLPGNQVLKSDNSYPVGTEGSPYLDEWELADIYLKNGKIISQLLVRYNVVNDQLLFKNNTLRVNNDSTKLKKETYIVGSPDSISEIKFVDKTFIYRGFPNGKKIEKGYFELAKRGKVTLLNKYEINVLPADYNIILNTGNKNIKLILVQKSYLVQGDKKTLINKESKIFEVLADKSKEVSDYIAREKLSYKIKDDMIKIVAFYNQLH